MILAFGAGGDSTFSFLHAGSRNIKKGKNKMTL